MSGLAIPISGEKITQTTYLDYEIESVIQRSENDAYINNPNYREFKTSSLDEIINDMGYNSDASNRIVGASIIYIGEREDDCPGRTRTGTLDPTDRDEADWYKFSVCKGQNIHATVDSTQDYGVSLANNKGESVSIPHTADETGWYYVSVFANDGAAKGEYHLEVTLNNQNDADTGGDAGNTIAQATTITPGEYDGYLDMNDQEDWYSFSVNAGQGIFASVEVFEKSDYDIYLYDPSGEQVHYAQYYGNDLLEFPADESGIWKIKLDIFPGWDATKWPDNYFLYGSGVYTLTLEIGGTASSPGQARLQPKINPIAQTFIVNDDPESINDEYGYLAAVPAANYIASGERFVSPIIYQGIDTITNWFGTIDDTTQYLIDDWESYLDRHGKTSEEFIIPSDPIQAAADIATNNWDSTDTAVVVCDGSDFEDEIETIIDDDFTMSSSPEISRYQPGDLRQFSPTMYAKPMFLGAKWGAIHMIALGENFDGDTGLLTPRYEEVKFDDWPSPYDVPGPDYDTWYPITLPGLWIPQITSENNLEELQIIKYPGDRYTIPIDTTDCSIELLLETPEASTLIAYLIDPEGNIRRPTIPAWNGGEIQQIHYWNGGHWQHNFDEYRYWIVEPHTEFSFDLHQPMTGDWTVIIVPYFKHPDHYGEYNGEYHLKVDIRNHNMDRINTALSAANGAVIASLNHAPLLYVTKDSVPTQTAQTLTALGVTKIIFVNLNEVSNAQISGTLTEYTTMQQIIDTIKSSPYSENYITITSLGSQNGYFASAAMIAAYHTSPVLSIHEAPVGYDTLDKMVKWEEYTSDHYHGCRTMGHLPAMQEPTTISNPPTLLNLILYYFTHERQLPPVGLDLKLQWYSQVYNSIHDMIDTYGLDREGQEAFMFVSPRTTDMPSHISRVMMGNESYAGQIPFDTPAMNTALICRNILYPALIYANPGREETSVCLMNHWEDNPWKTNDGQQWNNEFTRKVKEYYSSHGRTFKGHTLWENLLDQYNSGTSVLYHSSHGTGGSGICCMYENVEEQFPLAELTYEHLMDFNWWDGWRAYYYDDSVTKSPRENGRVWFNPTDDPYNNLYDIVHFKWCDQLFTNLHSQINLWQSCTTAHNFGPEIYLEHGAVLFYGNSNTGRSPQTDMQDSWWFEDFMVNGLSIGEAQSKILWLFDRDYTTNDPTSIYGVSSIDEADSIGSGDGQVNTWIILGDPMLQTYNPEWIEPVPVDP